jgi:hypothetical protein
MTQQQTFPAGRHPRLMLEDLNGSLSVLPWEQPDISVEAAGELPPLTYEGDVLRISAVTGDLTVRVPCGKRLFSQRPRGITDVYVRQLSGHATLEGVREVVLRSVGGSVHVKDCEGSLHLEEVREAVEVSTCGGDLEARQVPSLRVRDAIGGDVRLDSLQDVRLDAVGGNLQIRAMGERLQVGNVGGDCQVKDSPSAELLIGNVGGDLEIALARRVQVGNVGGDASVCEVAGDVTVSHIGGDASLRKITGAVETQAVGGDLRLEATFAPGSSAHLSVGGDARLVLSEGASLSIEAWVGGDICGLPSWARRSGRCSQISLVYGEGSARLQLHVGGDLVLEGPGQPDIRTHGVGVYWDQAAWHDFGREMSLVGEEVGREMARVGRELGRMGQEVGRELSRAFRDLDWRHFKHTHGRSWRQRYGTAAEARSAVLRMVAEGRLSPEEGDQLLRAIDE